MARGINRVILIGNLGYSMGQLGDSGMTYANQISNENSPRNDKNGRDLYRVKLTDGMNFKTIYIFAYSAEGAIEKAEGAHPYFRWSRCKKCGQNGS